MTRDWDDPNLPWHVRLDRAEGWQDVAFLRDCLTVPEARFGAARRLGELRAADAVPDLIRGLNANDDGYRVTVIKALTKIGDRPAYGPLLMMAGAADTTSPAQGVEQMAARLRALGAAVEYRLYPGLDHDPLVFGSFRDQLRWVEDRFAGRPASPN